MANYDLSAAFEAIEDELISSMINNLKRHRAEENELGYRWEQWQTLQLKALEDYRRQNQKKFPQRFNKLNNQIREVLQGSYNDGSTKQERKILQAIKHGFKGEPGTNAPAFTGQAEIEGNFFVTNDRKLDALITSTTHDVQKAEYSVLRQADDQYRQIIFNAQVYANTGAGTYEKAVDMATKDFLRAGINSIQYKNGSRHTIEDYADMAIKTAAKRAYLQGEGAKRQEYGVPTVILNKRSCPCPLCLPFVGKVFIDDVWSGGDSSGISPITGLEYPLLSEAIAQGLYHPRCRDSHSTYFEGINTAPEDSEYTADELDEIAQKYQAQQKQAYCERQEKCYSRMAEYSLDDDNKRIYAARANEWRQRLEGYKNPHSKAENTIETPFITVEKFNKSGIINTGQNFGKRRGQIDIPYEWEVPDSEIDKFNNNALKSIMEETGYNQEQAKQFQNALIEWFGDDYKEFTKGNRKEQEQIINRGLSKMGSYDGSISRGLNFKDEFEYLKLVNMKIGSIFPGKSVYAWSSENEVAKNYAAINYHNCNSVLIQCDNNKSAVGMQHISKHGKVEAELLAPSTARYKISEKQIITKYDYYYQQVLVLNLPSEIKEKKLQKLLKQKLELSKFSITFLKVKEM